MRLGIIAGTGQGSLIHRFSEPWGNRETPWGIASARLRSEPGLADPPVLFLARHGIDGAIAPHRINYRANIALLQAEGVGELLALNAVGGIAEAATAGQLVLPDQLIDYTWGRDPTFHEEMTRAEDFIDFSHPFSESLRQRLKDAAMAAGVPIIDGGVYGVTQGPRLETAAEIQRMERDGCHVVGMTGMPEAALAREAGLAYASLCMVVNRAAGKSGEAAIHAELSASVQAAGEAARRVMSEFLASG